MIGKLTWRNLWRNPRRTLITMSSIAFAVLLSVVIRSLQAGTFDNLVKNVVSFYYGYIQVHQLGYWDEQVLDNSFAINDTLIQQLEQNPHITTLVPRIETFVLASAGNVTKGCMVIGINPENENSLTRLRSKLISGAYLQPNEAEILISEGLAKRLDITTNDTLVLLGQGYHGTMAAGKYRVKGIVHFGSPGLNDGMVYLPLSTAQYFLSAENRITSLALAIDHPDNMQLIQEEVMAVAGKEFEVMNWKQLMPEIDNHMKADAVSLYVFSGILYFIIGFGIFGTILMMTAERRFEFGMLIAIGMKKMRLGQVLLYETILISVLGTIAGMIISLPVVILLIKQPIRLTGEAGKAYEKFGFEAVMPAILDGNIFLTQAIIILCIAFLIGLYPLWHVSRINPVAAMKK